MKVKMGFTLPPEEYGALREMLKERFQSRYYEI